VLATTSVGLDCRLQHAAPEHLEALVVAVSGGGWY
jgi:hypothetical protein